MNALNQLHADIDERVRAIRDNYPDWFCRLGCDSCCRRLAEIPLLTEAEWDWLRRGLAALPQEQLEEISQKIAALAEQQSRPIVCPLLEQSSGACRVYDHRPVACRTYGLYVKRDKGLYCRDIEARVTEGALADVVWGNHDAVDNRMRGLGSTRKLTEWFSCWKQIEFR